MGYQNESLIIQTPKGALYQREYTKGQNKGKVYCRIEWNPGFGPKYTGAFQSAQTAFAAECARLMDPYVPFDTGVLKNSVGLASQYETGDLIYPAPYARKQYYLHPQGQGIHDGKRGSYWGQRMIADHKAHLHSFVSAALKGKLK